MSTVDSAVRCCMASKNKEAGCHGRCGHGSCGRLRQLKFLELCKFHADCGNFDIFVLRVGLCSGLSGLSL